MNRKIESSLSFRDRVWRGHLVALQIFVGLAAIGGSPDIHSELSDPESIGRLAPPGHSYPSKLHGLAAAIQNPQAEFPVSIAESLDENGNPGHESSTSTFGPKQKSNELAKGTLVVGIDDRNAFDQDSVLGSAARFDVFRDSFTNLGISVVPLATFDSQDLAGLDALVVRQAGSTAMPFTTSEITAIQNFVSNGGGLLAHGEGGGIGDDFVSNINDLVAPYGVVYASTASENDGHTITGFLAHPVTAGVSTIGVDFQRRIISITSPAVDLTTGSGADEVLAVVDGQGGAGNVVLITDASMWASMGNLDRSITFGDNQLYLNNIIMHIVSGPGTGGNRVPDPAADIFSLLEGNTLSGNVTSNDDLGDGLGSVALETPASNGTLSLSSSGSFTYNPDGPGTDVFSYSITDADGDTSSLARVTITTAPNPGLAIIIDIDPGGDFAQQLDDAISQANGGNQVVRVRFPPGIYQYGGSAKSLLATAISGRVVVEAMGTPVTIRGQGPNGGQWLEISQGTLEIKSLIIENFGSGLGGALHAFDGGTLRVSDSTLRNNTSSGLGGAILSGSGAQTTIERSTLRGNTASGGGGGVRAESGSSLTVTGSTFLNNTADTGGGISFGDGDANCTGSSCAVIADVSNVTFEGNQATSGGALSVELSAGDNNDSIRIEKATFADNSASGTGCDVLVEDQRSAEATDKIVFSDSAFFGDCADSRIEGSVGGFTIADSTVVHDGTGVRGTGTVNLRGTVLTDSSLVGKSGPRADSGKDACETTAGVFSSLGFNLSSDASCGLTQATDLPDTDPMIQRSGKDFSILAGSPILDSGPSELLTLLAGEKPQLPCGYKDTNGLGRPQDSNDDGTYECDIGNVEAKNGPDTSGATSSAYFDPARPGEGVFVEVLDGGLVFLAMFTYQIDASGPVWLVGVGQSVGNTIVVDEMLLTGGGIFGPDFNSDAIVRTPVGGMSMVFRDCSTGDGKPGRLAFQALLGSPFTDLLVDSSRLTTIVNCNQTAPPAFAGRSGSFFDPARNGEGIFVQWQEDGRVLVIWYTYDGDGNQFWTISGDAQVNGSAVTASMLYPAQGTGFGQNFDPSEIVLEEWGTMTLEYAGCNALVLSYDSSLEGFGQGSYNYQRLTTIGGTSCDL